MSWGIYLRPFLSLPRQRLSPGVVAGGYFMSILLMLFASPQPAQAANFVMRTGYYVGSGATKTITGLGFQPQFVVVTPSTNAGVSLFKTSSMPVDESAFFSATANDTNSSIAFISGGFTVGTLANVNNVNVLYRWVAFQGSDCTSNGYFCVGGYSGNGSASRTITTGFRPGMIMVKRSTNVAAHFHTGSMDANRTEYFTSTAANTAGAFIADTVSSGFTIGASDNASGGSYYYIAFRGGAGTFTQASYTGNATNRSIAGLGFQPDWVIVKNSTGSQAASRRSVISSDKHFGNDASYLSDAVADGANMITGMESNGFSVGTANQTNQSGQTVYYMAFGGAPKLTGGSGSFQMAQGSYTGNGGTQTISGLSFRPDLVMVNGEGSTYAVYRTDYMEGDATTYFANAVADFAGGITSITGSGFTIGANATVNTNGTGYHWQAFGNAYDSSAQTGAADFATGAYYGTGADNRDIQDLPFEPDLVVIKRAGSSRATVRTSLYEGDLSGYFSSTADAADLIQSFGTNGFQLGTNAVTNGSGSVYRWFAFKIGTNFNLGSYTGNGVSGTHIAAPFWSDLVWVNRASGTGSVQRPSTLGGVYTQGFMNTAMITEGVRSIDASGFTVGSNGAVNTNAAAYRYAVWRVPPTGNLSIDIVDGSGASVSTPSVGFNLLNFSLNCTESSAFLGAASQRIRVSNMSANAGWILSIAPTAGAGALWNSSGGTDKYDFNDISGTQSGCADGADGDAFAGKLRVEPSSSNIAPQDGCSTANVTRGFNQDFSDGVVNSASLVTAAAGSNTECYWDITDINLRQMIPPEQPPNSYSLNLIITITAQ